MLYIFTYLYYIQLHSITSKDSNVKCKPSTLPKCARRHGERGCAPKGWAVVMTSARRGVFQMFLWVTSPAFSRSLSDNGTKWTRWSLNWLETYALWAYTRVFIFWLKARWICIIVQLIDIFYICMIMGASGSLREFWLRSSAPSCLAVRPLLRFTALQ